MRTFKRYGLFILWTFYFKGVSGQHFSFEDYQNYRYDKYLNIPLPLLASAYTRLQMGDTSGAFHELNSAIENGLYEPIRLVNSQRFKSLNNRKEWKSLLDHLQALRTKYSDPGKIQLFTSDVTNFFAILPYINRQNADRLLMQGYFLKGSPGLKAFFDLKLNSNPEVMVNKIRTCINYYNSIKGLQSSIPALLPSIRAATRTLKDYYPNSIFPPIYFIIGVFNIGGTPDIANGILVGSEFFGASPETDTAELSESEKFALYDTSRLLPVVIHEFIHIEQKKPWGRNLLEQSVIEGSCDFIASLLVNRDINPRLHEYGDLHETELWEKFKIDSASTDYSQWLYNGSKMKGTGKPANLGYYMGYKICESYFKRTGDIKKTIKDILEIENFETFLSESGYAQKFINN